MPPMPRAPAAPPAPAGAAKDRALRVSIVVETYNLAEGTERALLEQALTTALRAARARDGECLLVDTSAGADGTELLVGDLAAVRHVHAPGHGYDDAKHAAARAARGTSIVYLDGDCLPDDDDWVDALLAPIESGDADVVSGHTVYDGGRFARLWTVLDFGWFLDEYVDQLGCYSSNNCAFRREALLALPAPSGPMRCRCYAHAQLFLRAGRPVHFAPRARVRHALPRFFSERLRQGYDMVAACWVNPLVPEARWLRLRGVAAIRLYFQAWQRDLRRVRYGRHRIGMRKGTERVGRVLLPLCRLVDAVGMLQALWFGPKRPRQVTCNVAPGTTPAR